MSNDVAKITKMRRNACNDHGPTGDGNETPFTPASYPLQRCHRDVRVQTGRRQSSIALKARNISRSNHSYLFRRSFHGGESMFKIPPTYWRYRGDVLVKRGGQNETKIRRNFAMIMDVHVRAARHAHAHSVPFKLIHVMEYPRLHPCVSSIGTVCTWDAVSLRSPVTP